MNERLALRLLSRVMGWTEAQANEEFGWLRLVSQLKYDSYGDYVAGVRFSESLAGWLQQFEGSDRTVAYAFVRQRLLYFSPPEMARLVALFYPETVEPELKRAAAFEAGIEPYLLWGDGPATHGLLCRRRRTLFIGMSDGARIDLLRRANNQVLTQEQILVATHVDDQKWRSLSGSLAEDPLLEGVMTPKFDAVYLVDDFTASGTTLLRKKDGKWKGKLPKFRDAIAEASKRLKGAFPLADDFQLTVHHYMSTMQARESIEERLAAWNREEQLEAWLQRVRLTEGLLLPAATKMTDAEDAAMLAICGTYYDHALFTRLKEHAGEAGQTHMRVGYADCALPIVLDHNTPNNSISLLWAETEGKDGHAMRPLFRRRDRHG